jgi:hypothetical protein
MLRRSTVKLIASIVVLLMSGAPNSRSEIVRKAWLKRRLTFVPPMKGKKMSDETRRKMSAAAKARPSNRIGKKHSLETRAIISQRTRERAARGEAAPGYIDGKGHERRGLRHTAELKRWRYDVFTRDGFACCHCGDNRGGNLHAHHIKPFATYPDLRFVIENGITLCEPCHWLAHQVDLPGLC